MEARIGKSTKKRATKTRPTKKPKDIKRAFVEYWMEHEKKPASVYKLCKFAGIDESDFYGEHGSIKALEKSLWEGYATDTIKTLMTDDNYATFTSREKVLAFYFTLLETIRMDRDYISLRIKEWRLSHVHPPFVNRFRKQFDAWAIQLIAEGKDSGEIKSRPFLDGRYHQLLWFHLHFILQFWVSDDSTDFERTDAAIEKSVNLAFELVGEGVLDKVFDFGKFLVQQARD